MKSENEILHEYIDRQDKNFYDELSHGEQILYLCQVRDTIGFKRYLLSCRMYEFFKKFVETMKGEL